MTTARLLLPLLLLAPAATAPSATAAMPDAFLDAHCAGCHNAEKHKGGLDLAAVPFDPANPTRVALWGRLFARVAAGEMPPPERPRPPAADRTAATTAIAAALADAERAARGTQGRRVLRRLTRTEFEHTLRDLLDLPELRIADMLPEDGRAAGYDKLAAALDVSPLLLAKYDEAVDRALDAATAKYSVPPTHETRTIYLNQQYDFMVLMGGGDAVMLKDKQYDATRFPMPSARDDSGFKYPNGPWQFGGKYKGLHEAEKGGAFKEPSTVGLTRTMDESHGGRLGYVPIHPGKYTVRVSAWSYWWEKGTVKPAPRGGAAAVYVGGQLLRHVDAPSLTPTVTEFTAHLDPKPFEFLSVAAASIWNTHVYFSQGQIGGYSGPGVAIDSVTIEGPIYDEWPPPSHRRLFGSHRVAPLSELPAGAPRPKRAMPKGAYNASNNPGRIVFGAAVSDDPGRDARPLLAAFLPRAFRRPVSAETIDRYHAVALARLAAEDSFEDALKAAYRTALLSPEFLFLHEDAGPLDAFALAARLSYFLWASTPDDALLDLARTGSLRTPEVLRRQVARLLADPKAERFHADFLNQWLDLRDFDATSPDKSLYPEYTPYLADAIRREPTEFFREALKSDLRASELVATNVNVLNQRLAEHYGIGGIDGTRFRRHDIDWAKTPRGGFLTMAAVQKVTANGTTTTPVKRGAWVMKKLVGLPPQPPPPDIPAVEPDVKGAVTIREQLAKHRDQSACAGCHARFDPPGFALESFDPIGGYRARYRSVGQGDAPDAAAMFPSHRTPDGKFTYHVGFKLAKPADPSGELRDGRTFKDVRQFRDLLLADPARLDRNFLEQLVLYATGAPAGFADRPEIDRILAQSQGGRVRTLIGLLAESQLFLHK